MKLFDAALSYIFSACASIREHVIYFQVKDDLNLIDRQVRNSEVIDRWALFISAMFNVYEEYGYECFCFALDYFEKNGLRSFFKKYERIPTGEVRIPGEFSDKMMTWCSVSDQYNPDFVQNFDA